MSSETITTISPITNKPVVTRAGILQHELAELPKNAQQAFRSFSRSTTLAQRQEIVTKALDLLEKKKDDLAPEITEQMGRPVRYTGVEISTAIKRGHYLNSVSGPVLGDTIDAEPETGFKRYLKKKPVGVVLVMFPWNVRPICRSSNGLLGVN